MISRELLDKLMYAELAILIASLSMLFSHGVWLFFADRRRERLTTEARRRLSLALSEESVSPLDASFFNGLPKGVKTTVFLELARNLAGEKKEQLRGIARASGFITDARRLTRSWFWRNRLRGARILAQIGQPDPVMRTLLRDPNLAVRAQAAEWAALHPTPAIVDELLEALGEPLTEARFAVEDALLQMGAGIVPQLGEFLKLRSGAAAEAGLGLAAAIGDGRLLEAALNHSGAAEPEVKCAAVGLLAAIGGSAASERLGALLDDGDGGVRAAAAAGVGRLKDWVWAPRLGRLLSDPEWRVRRDAAFGLREIGGPGVLLLRRAAGSSDRNAAEIAQLALDVPAGAR